MQSGTRVDCLPRVDCLQSLDSGLRSPCMLVGHMFGKPSVMQRHAGRWAVVEIRLGRLIFGEVCWHHQSSQQECMVLPTSTKMHCSQTRMLPTYLLLCGGKPTRPGSLCRTASSLLQHASTKSHFRLEILKSEQSPNSKSSKYVVQHDLKAPNLRKLRRS